jgi:hypothetical protein
LVLGIIHHDFEVTKAGMEKKGRKLRVMRWEAVLGKAKKRAGTGRPCIEVEDFKGRLGR